MIVKKFMILVATPSKRVSFQIITFCFDTASRPALEPTQPPIQWVQRALSLRVKQPGHEADHSPPYSAEVKECVEIYFHSPIRLNGVVLN
jgi:hypothetical protein